MGYLASTVPSDYDLEQSWTCTIGVWECEVAAYALTEYLQTHGDQWRSVPVEEVPRECWRLVRKAEERGQSSVEMPEQWLAQLQRVRVPRPGPAELISNSRARGGLQRRHANGHVIAAAFEFTDEEMAQLRRELKSRGSRWRNYDQA